MSRKNQDAQYCRRVLKVLINKAKNRKEDLLICLLIVRYVDIEQTVEYIDDIITRTEHCEVSKYGARYIVPILQIKHNTDYSYIKELTDQEVLKLLHYQKIDVYQKRMDEMIQQKKQQKKEGKH